ncbi:MAG: c-type cytochrome [Saprospiraceae bacterium]|jgi:cytochrome c oxidase cbb3-type subunit 3|nr:c-type cytochrome [Saprospiraceae bacterium]
MKKICLRPILLAATSLLPLAAWAQDATTAAAAATPDFWPNTLGTLTLVVAGVVIIGALIAITRLFSSVVKMQEIQMLREKGIEEVVEAYRQPEQSWWDRLMKSMTNAVPVSREADIDLGHDYDGIRELDNKMPPWWLGLFYGSIIFSAIYLFAFHLSDIGPSSKQEYDTEVEVAKAEVNAYLATVADAVDENNVTALTDEQELALGKSIFEVSCATCHGKLGEGGIGPNMTDDYWIHGGGIQNVFKTIKNGVPEKGMISWADQLRASDMQRVASYILTLRGTNPPNGKAQQGTLYDPATAGEGTTPAADSTATSAVPAPADSTATAAPAAKK